MPDALTVTDLEIRAGARVLVRHGGLGVEAGEVVALVGRSGSGKTLTARALLGLVDVRPGVVRGRIEVRAGDATHRPAGAWHGGGRSVRDRAFRALRGRWISYMPQGAVGALDPLWTVGRQVGRSAGGDPLPWLGRAGFPASDRAAVAALYPHELSGGMAQRAVLAQCLARGSRYLIADEPTSGLDPEVRVEITAELRRLAGAGVGLLVVTHDLRALPHLADRVLVLDGGDLVDELGPDALSREELPPSAAARRLVEGARRVHGRGRP